MAEYRLTQYGPEGMLRVEADCEHEARLYLAAAILQDYAASAGARVTGRLKIYEHKEDDEAAE